MDYEQYRNDRVNKSIEWHAEHMLNKEVRSFIVDHTDPRFSGKKWRDCETNIAFEDKAIEDVAEQILAANPQNENEKSRIALMEGALCALKDRRYTVSYNLQRVAMRGMAEPSPYRIFIDNEKEIAIVDGQVFPYHSMMFRIQIHLIDDLLGEARDLLKGIDTDKARKKLAMECEED